MFMVAALAAELTRPLFAVASYGRPMWNRADHYIFALWFLLSSFFLFFLALSQPSKIGCLPYFHTRCGLSANLECRSETCCTRHAENTGRKNAINSLLVRSVPVLQCS